MLCSRDAGGGAEALPAYMQVLHYEVGAGPLPPSVPNQQLEPSPCSSNTPWQSLLPVPSTDLVGMQ